MTTIAQQLRDRLATGGGLTLDAGTGTELQARGAAMHPKVWCGMAHMTHPEIAVEVHREYIHAGADIITANTFSTNRNMMGPGGLGDEASATTRRAVELALKARDEASPDRPVAVAGSMSHQVPVIPGTSTRNPDTIPKGSTTVRNFSDHAQALKDAGVDLILMEMMSDPDLAIPAMKAALDTGLPVWVGLSSKAAEDGTLMSHHRAELRFADVHQQVLEEGGEVAGIMHSAIGVVDPAIDMIRQNFDGPLMAYPDSGEFKMPDWQFENVITPEDFAKLTQRWRENGIQIVGGCCGLGIDHIHALPSA